MFKSKKLNLKQLNKKNTVLLILASMILLFFIVLSNQKQAQLTQIAKIDSQNQENNSFITLKTNEQVSFKNISADFINPPTWPTSLPDLEVNLQENINFNQWLQNFCKNTTNYYSCSYYNNNDFIEITKNNSDDIEDVIAFGHLPLIKFDEAIALANNFLNSITPGLSLITQVSSVSYFSGGLEYTESAPEEANIIEINYDYAYQNVPVIISSSKQSSFKLQINKLTGVQKIEAFTQTASFKTGEEVYPLLSITNALKQLEEVNSGYVLQINNFKSNNINSLLDLSLIQEINVDQVILEYRYKKEVKKSLPVYHLFGTALDKNLNSISIEIIASAAKV